MSEYAESAANIKNGFQNFIQKAANALGVSKDSGNSNSNPISLVNPLNYGFNPMLFGTADKNENVKNAVTDWANKNVDSVQGFSKALSNAIGDDMSIVNPLQTGYNPYLFGTEPDKDLQALGEYLPNPMNTGLNKDLFSADSYDSDTAKKLAGTYANGLLMSDPFALDQSYADNFKAQSAKASGDNGGSSEKAGATQKPKSAKQRDVYNEGMLDPERAAYYQANYDPAIYGDLTGEYGFDNFNNIGDAIDYSYKAQMLRDMYGLNKEHPEVAIPGLIRFAVAAGLDPSDPDFIDKLMDRKWGDGNYIDTGAWTSNADYQKSHAFDDIIPGLASTAWLANEMSSPYENGFFGSLMDAEGNPLYSNLDEADLRAWVSAGNLLNSNLSNMSDEQFSAIANMLAGAGYTPGYQLVDSQDESAFMPSDRDYSVESLYQALYDQIYNNGVPIAVANNAINGGNDIISGLDEDIYAAIENANPGKRVVKK